MALASRLTLTSLRVFLRDRCKIPAPWQLPRGSYLKSGALSGLEEFSRILTGAAALYPTPESQANSRLPKSSAARQISPMGGS